MFDATLRSIVALAMMMIANQWVVYVDEGLYAKLECMLSYSHFFSPLALPCVPPTPPSPATSGSPFDYVLWLYKYSKLLFIMR